MFYQMAPLEYTIADLEIELDDRWHGSDAIYRLSNPQKRIVKYACPDDWNEGEPRCDYLLYIETLNIVKFIELKGKDAQTRDCKICKTTWGHGFHQLEATYDRCYSMLEEKDKVFAFLCTSLPSSRRSAARYTQYPKYKSLLLKLKGNLKVLFSDMDDRIE